MKINDDQFAAAYNRLVEGSGEGVEYIVPSLPPVLAVLAGPEAVECAQVESVEVDDVNPREVHWTIVAATPTRLIRLRLKTPQNRRDRSSQSDAELLEPARSWPRSTITSVSMTEVYIQAGRFSGEAPEAESSWVITVSGEQVTVPTVRPRGHDGRTAVSRLITELLRPKAADR